MSEGGVEHRSLHALAVVTKIHLGVESGSERVHFSVRAKVVMSTSFASPNH